MSVIEMKSLPTWSTASTRPFIERMYSDIGCLSFEMVG
jgi:hypothetical protein